MNVPSQFNVSGELSTLAYLTNTLNGVNESLTKGDEDFLKDRPPKQVAREEVLEWQITTYSAPIILTIGIIGNIVSFLIFSRKSLNYTVNSIFFRALALFDIITLLEISEYVFFIFNIDTISMNVWSCKISFYIIWVAKSCSAWTLVLMSLERVIGIWMPHKLKAVCTKTRAKIAVLMIVISFLALYSPFFVLYRERHRYVAVRGRKVPFCGRTDAVVQVYAAIAPFKLEIIFYSFAPFLILLSLNIIISCGLLVAQRKMEQTLSADRGRDSAMMGLTAMLLMTSATFIFLTAPFCIYYLVRQYVIKSREHPLYIQIRPFRYSILFQYFNLQQTVTSCHSIEW